MKKRSSKIKQEIARLQEQLKQAETREAERIGRVALKAGLGEIEVEESQLQAAFEELAGRFRTGKGGATGRREAGDGKAAVPPSQAVAAGRAAGDAGEA